MIDLKDASKIFALEAKLKRDGELVKQFRSDPDKFLADFGLDPDEISMVKSAQAEEINTSCEKNKSGLTVGESTNLDRKWPCSCCAVIYSACGSGCIPRPVGGHTVGE